MVYRTWQDLEKEFAPEINGVWVELYPKKTFIEQTIKKAHHYYSLKPNPPETREAWSRALLYFMEKNWSSHPQTNTTTTTASSPSASSKYGFNPHSPHYEKNVRYEEIRQQLRAIQGRGVDDCPKCLNHGTVGMYNKKNKGYYVFGCDCRASELAMQLPEYSVGAMKIRRYTEVNPDDWELS